MSARLDVESYLSGVLSPQLADLAKLNEEERAGWLMTLPAEVRRRLPYVWEFWARPGQIWRPGPELVTLVQAGRGWGKTRYGAQAVRYVAEHPEECGFGRPPFTESAPIIGLVARTAHDAIATMIRGQSGILACSPPWFRPRFLSSDKMLVWPNGLRAYYYTAERPETLRGPNFGFVWADEVAFFRDHGGDRVGALENIEQALRKGCARAVYTTTPTPTATMFSLHRRSRPRRVAVSVPRRHYRSLRDLDEADEPDTEPEDDSADHRPVSDQAEELPQKIVPPDVRIVRGSSLDNSANQDAKFIARQAAKRGTRIGRQEVDGELLEGNPRTMFPYEMMNGRRIDPFEISAQRPGESWPNFLRRVLDLDRVCLAADPNGTDPDDPNSDNAVHAEFGISVAGIGRDGREYTLADLSDMHSPFVWPELIYDTAVMWSVDAIVSETNYGGAMVRAAVETFCRGLRDKGIDVMPIQFVEVSAGKGGKVSRLKVFAQAMELGLVWSVGDPSYWAPLEAQLHSFNPAENPDKQVARVEISLADGTSQSITMRLDRLDARVWAHLWLTGSDIVGDQTSFWIGGKGGADAVAMLREIRGLD